MLFPESTRCNVKPEELSWRCNMAVFAGYVIKFTSDNYMPPRVEAFGPVNQDLDSDKSTRNLKGVLFRDRVAIIPDMELEIPNGYTEDEMGALLSHLSPVKFQVQYWDAETKSYKTNYFYCPSSGRRAEILKYSPLLYKGMKFKLIGYNNV